MLPLDREQEVYVRQKYELAELFGFESRNKYEITRGDRTPIGFAAEQSKGLMGILGRQFLGHWRSFELIIFDSNRHIAYRAVHPFRFFFQRLELYDASGRFIGAVQSRFAFLYKKLQIEGPNGQVAFDMASAPWKVWTFPFKRRGREVGVLKKKWSGLLTEAMTDKDNFHLTFGDSTLNIDERLLMLTATFFIDLIYFENKAGK